MPDGVSRSFIRMIFSITSIDLVYPGNQQFNHLYQLAHIRTNVPEKRRIKVRTVEILPRINCLPIYGLFFLASINVNLAAVQRLYRPVVFVNFGFECGNLRLKCLT